MKNFSITFALCMMFTLSHAWAQDSGHVHHENHDHRNHVFGPIGVMGAHTHSQGDWMISYRFNTMNMGGNRKGTSEVSAEQVLNDFMVSPTEMTMHMHMFGLMYGKSDDFTLMGMLPYTLISMDHMNRMGARFSTESEGIGDVKLTGLYTIYEQGQMKLLLNAGLSLPTGSIDERDGTPSGADQKLPYPMQLGSGTYDMMPGITYTDMHGDWFWGGQLNAVIRPGKNDNDYVLGNRYGLTAWGARKLADYARASFRLDGEVWENIYGADPELNPMMVPTARTDLRSGKRIELLFGINFIAPKGHLDGNRISFEVGFPIYQDLDGPQLEFDYRVTAGWQWVF